MQFLFLTSQSLATVKLHVSVVNDILEISFYRSPLILQMLHQHVVKSLSHNDFPVVISVFRLIRHIQGLLPEYKTVLYVGVVSTWAWFHL
jgi:hypothetical protein